MSAKPSPLDHLASLPEQAIHRGNRAQVVALVQQSGVHLRRGQVHEAIGVKLVDNTLLLENRKPSARHVTGTQHRPFDNRIGLVSSVKGGARQGKRLASGSDGETRACGLGRANEVSHTYSCGSRERPISSDTFFWRSKSALAFSSSRRSLRFSRSETARSLSACASDAADSVFLVVAGFAPRSPRASCLRKSWSVE